MPLRRARAARGALPAPPDSTMRITVEVTVEVTGDGVQTSSFYDMDRPTTPMIPAPPVPTPNNSPLRHPSSPDQNLDTQIQPISSYTETALRAIAQDAVYGFHAGMMFIFPEPPPGFRVLDIEEALRITDATMNEILSYGQHMIAAETLEAHANAISEGDVENDVPVSIWMQRLGPLGNIDKPLFFFLRDSLRSHTPQHILFRWGLLHRHLRDAGETIASLVRLAEQEPRKKWTPVVLELYFLLLDHNEALIESTPTLRPYLGSLELKLSALTTGLRIRYHLFRMTRASPMGGLRAYKRQLRATGIISHMKELYGLVAQEFARMQDPAFGHFQSTERALFGEPVKIESITTPLEGHEPTFCTICQDEHSAYESVQPLNCHCIFGRDCLSPILNRDLPFSNACPNCRTQLHEPLQWRPILSRGERDLRAGLLWALRSNMLSLKREIQADPDPFTPHQRMVGWVRRLVYGNLRRHGGISM